MNDHQKILDTYKPFKKIIKTTSMEDSLFVVWAYSQNIQTGNPMPPNIGIHPIYLSKNPMQKGVYQWSLETLTKEILINADRIQYSNRIHQTFRDPNLLMNALNQLTKIENAIATEFLSEKNILKEFSRIAFRQFSWQRDFANNESLMRYYKIFSCDGVANIINDVIGLSIEDLFLFTLCFTGQYLKNPVASFSLGNEEFSRKVIRYIEYFSKDIDTLRKDLISEHNIDEQYLYAGAKLRLYPLIRMTYQNDNHCIVCPIPTLFFWRVTSGLYYDIVAHKNFNRAFGKAFEKYVGMTLNKVFDSSPFKVIQESKYIVHRSDEDTVDWILIDPNAAIFIECKAKRMTLNSKVHLNNSEYILKDLKTLADNIVKLYKTMKDYEENHYSTLGYQSDRIIFPLMLTLESWYIFHEEYRNNITEYVLAGLSAAGIAPDVLQRTPYTLCCISEFEEMIQIIKHTGIYDFFEPKFRNLETSNFEIGTYCGENFGHIDTTSLFLDEYDTLLNESRLLLKKLHAPLQ